MYLTFPRTRQFIHDHPILTHTVVASVAFVAGCRAMSDVWREVIVEELGPEVLDRLEQIHDVIELPHVADR